MGAGGDCEREPSDEDLVRRVRGGDAAAVAILFDRHLPALRAQARRRLDATQLRCPERDDSFLMG